MHAKSFLYSVFLMSCSNQINYQKKNKTTFCCCILIPRKGSRQKKTRKAKTCILILFKNRLDEHIIQGVLLHP